MRQAKPTKRVLMTFVIDTNAEEGELDDLLSHGSETLFPGVDPYQAEQVDVAYVEYQAEGSHWRELQPPYPWCHGNPTTLDCIKRGYCRRSPTCGD